MKPIVIGDPMNDKTIMEPVISERAANNIEAQVNKTIEQGAVLYYGGKRDGAFYYPTVLTNCTAEMDVMRDREIGFWS